MTDPVTLEIVRNACITISEEMSSTLVRTAYSPNIKDRMDSSCAVFDASGEMVSQAENIPVHLGALPFAVSATTDRFPPETLRPGDAILLNDPFEGGAHLPDLTLVSPIFHDGAVVGYATNRAHHTDVGGGAPGSNAPNSTEVYQEGIRIPPVKLVEGGEVDASVMDLLLANTRTETERRGDLRAQIAANNTGRRRFRSLVEKHGTDVFRETLTAIKAYSERRMRTEIRKLPDGTYEFTELVDDDGCGNVDLRIHVEVTIEGGGIAVDFAGTVPQVDGPVNMVLPMTAASTYFAVHCLVPSRIPPNHGCYRPISIDAPEGSLVNANPPAAVVDGHGTAHLVAEAVLGAVATAIPERVKAGDQGSTNVTTFGGVDPDTDAPYTFYESHGGGFGGRSGSDGMDAVKTGTSNTRNTPVEQVETTYPLRVLRYEMRPDSGGAGTWRGGLGIRRDVLIRGHRAVFVKNGNRRRHAPYGVAGGEDGQRGADFVVRNGVETPLKRKCVRELAPGDVVSTRTPGGGGYGDPKDRSVEAVARDVARGTVSPGAAEETYGVAVTKDGTVAVRDR